jgi:hypothetical protein
MFAIVIFLITAALALVRIRIREEAVPIEIRGTCYRCGYELTGLPHGAICPECGTGTVDQFRQRRRTVVETNRQLRSAVLLGVPLLVAYLIVREPLAVRLVALSYQAMGYPADASRKAAAARELARMPMATLLWPLCGMVGLWPVAVWIMRPRWGALVWAALVALVIALVALGWMADGRRYVTPGP